MIDVNRLPQRALFDTGIVIRALGERPEDPRSLICEGLWEAMVENGREILIAVPSIAEMIRQEGKGAIPHRRGVEVVALTPVPQNSSEGSFPSGYSRSNVRRPGCRRTTSSTTP